jgi:hypothetical protein
MDWQVEIRKIYGDEQTLRAVIEGAGYELIQEVSGNSNSWILKHSKYNSFDSAQFVYDDANNLATSLSAISRIEGEDFRLEIGAVLKKNEDGSTNKIVFASVFEHLTLTAHVAAVAIHNPNNSEEERSRLTKEAERREADRKKAAKVARMKAALRNPRVLQVQELLAIPNPSGTELGHIVDLVKADCAGDMRSFCSNAELSRFYNSINNSSVLGLEARHLTKNYKPPAKPMKKNEARAFAHGIGRKWLQTYEKGE